VVEWLKVVKEANMGARTLRISYPEKLLEALGKTPEEFELEMKFLMAAKLYELGRIASGRAAELAEMSRVEFLEALGQYNISPFNYSPEELDREIQEAQERARKTL
jgi:predicted HTH domain antitoxin